MARQITFCIILCFLSGCGHRANEATNKPRQLNVSILLDLSDRIDHRLHPYQSQIDTENIKVVIQFFKKQSEDIGVFEAKGKLKIFFYPPPTNEDIITIAKRLTIDFGKVDSTSMDGISEKIRMFQSFDSVFLSNIRRLYKYASAKTEYPGADIWTFFNDEVEDQCVESDNSYRNVLVIITDGYMYWKDNVRSPIGKRYTSITPITPQLTRFRNLKNWEEAFEKGDYGFVNVKKKLSNLEILVLGIDPAHPEDFEIIKKYWIKWFNEMEIKPQNVKILKTELPVKEAIIEKFFYKSH